MERVSANVRLADYLKIEADCIVREWTSFARSQVPASEHMSTLALEDHVRNLLEFVATDLQTRQTEGERTRKSKGLVTRVQGAGDSAAETHADLRIKDGFNLDQAIAEFRALRSSMVALWSKARDQALAAKDFGDLTPFNESIDQLLAESVERYCQKVDQRKNLFLAVIGHDLANPIAAAAGGARLLTREGNLNDRQKNDRLANIGRHVSRQGSARRSRRPDADAVRLRVADQPHPDRRRRCRPGGRRGDPDDIPPPSPST